MQSFAWVCLQVLSLGDQRSYYLGTAKNELGVVYAKHPISGGACAEFQTAGSQVPTLVERVPSKLLSAA